jgi:hypothetical protein
VGAARESERRATARLGWRAQRRCWARAGSSGCSRQRAWGASSAEQAGTARRERPERRAARGRGALRRARRLRARQRLSQAQRIQAEQAMGRWRSACTRVSGGARKRRPE